MDRMSPLTDKELHSRLNHTIDVWATLKKVIGPDTEPVKLIREKHLDPLVNEAVERGFLRRNGSRWIAPRG